MTGFDSTSFSTLFSFVNEILALLSITLPVTPFLTFAGITNSTVVYLARSANFPSFTVAVTV